MRWGNLPHMERTQCVSVCVVNLHANVDKVILRTKKQSSEVLVAEIKSNGDSKEHETQIKGQKQRVGI